MAKTVAEWESDLVRLNGQISLLTRWLQKVAFELKRYQLEKVWLEGKIKSLSESDTKK